MLSDLNHISDEGVETRNVEHKLGSLLLSCKLSGGAAKSLMMLRWSYSGIREMQSGPRQVLNLCAMRSDFVAVTKLNCGIYCLENSWMPIFRQFGEPAFPFSLKSMQSGISGYFTASE